MKYLFLNFWAIIVLFTNATFSQNKTYLGFETAIANDKYEITDNGMGLKTVPLVQGLWGFNLRQDLSNYLFLETGLIRKYYSKGFGFENFNSHGSSNSIDAWMIPLRLGTKINLYKEKIYIVPVVGYSYCINSDYGSYGYGGGTIKISNDSVSYNFTSQQSLTRHFSLLQTGLGFEFKLFKSVLFSISTNYFTGFTKVVELNIYYTNNYSPYFNGKVFSKGEFLSVGAGLKYPISNFWKKKSS